MAHVLAYTDLVKIADGIGITLEEDPAGHANLYVIVCEEGYDLYIGKAASDKRHLEEDGWAESDHTTEVVSGFLSLWRENNASRRRLSYDPASFRPAAALAAIEREGWHGPVFDRARARLEAGEPPTVEEVETILIRIHVRSGRLVGNSSGASQWEAPIGRFTDTLAALAVDHARTSGIIPAPSVAGNDPKNRQAAGEVSQSGVVAEPCE